LPLLAEAKSQFLTPIPGLWDEAKAGGARELNYFQRDVLQEVQRRRAAGTLGLSAEGKKVVTGIMQPTGTGKTLEEGLLAFAMQCEGDTSAIRSACSPPRAHHLSCRRPRAHCGAEPEASGPDDESAL
jgi:hypothetical protein